MGLLEKQISAEWESRLKKRADVTNFVEINTQGMTKNVTPCVLDGIGKYDASEKNSV